ncbi:MAG: RNA polymerase sigma-70 factor [Arachidicoccus sp.]|nr:RNA polymerase sigma-70 factor [Arachidicoccus sp.]
MSNTLNTYSDEELYRLMQSGNENAFVEIYKRYWDKLYYIAVKKINQFQDGENLVQEVFMDLWNRRKSCNIQILSAYLCAAIKYRIINYMAKQDRNIAYQSYLLVNEHETDKATEEWLNFDELQNWLQQTVAALPEKCRLVYQLREEGYTRKEIAYKMHISEKTVENHITRALKIIKAGLSHFVCLIFF